MIDTAVSATFSNAGLPYLYINVLHETDESSRDNRIAESSDRFVALPNDDGD